MKPIKFSQKDLEEENKRFEERKKTAKPWPQDPINPDKYVPFKIDKRHPKA